MVRPKVPDDCCTPNVIYQRIQAGKGQSVVLTPSNMFPNRFNVYLGSSSYDIPPTLSVVICAGGRESLIDTLISLAYQNFKDFEVVIRSEKDDLSKVRQAGLEQAQAPLVSFIDDDVWVPQDWAEFVIWSFTNPRTVGVTGPTTITSEFSGNRDIIRLGAVRRLHDLLFAVPSLPTRLSPCGAPSMASNFERQFRRQEVDYLECCNMSVIKKEALNVGGFDTNYKRTSEWCELDLALRLRDRGILMFEPRVALYHRPSKSGVYADRLATSHRWENFIRFQRRWEGRYIKPGARTTLYRGFIWSYLRLKERLKF